MFCSRTEGRKELGVVDKERVCSELDVRAALLDAREDVLARRVAHVRDDGTYALDDGVELALVCHFDDLLDDVVGEVVDDEETKSGALVGAGDFVNELFLFFGGAVLEALFDDVRGELVAREIDEIGSDGSDEDAAVSVTLNDVIRVLVFYQLPEFAVS